MTEASTTDTMAQAEAFYLANSEINKHGVRVVRKDVFMKALKNNHGIEESDAKAVQTAIDFETQAAAGVARIDLCAKIAEASKEDLTNEEFRKGLTAEVRIPTFGGNTEIEIFAEKHTPVPSRGDVPASVKIEYGKLRTKINAKGRITPAFHDDSRARLKEALGL